MPASTFLFNFAIKDTPGNAPEKVLSVGVNLLNTTRFVDLNCPNDTILSDNDLKIFQYTADYITVEASICGLEFVPVTCQILF